MKEPTDLSIHQIAKKSTAQSSSCCPILPRGQFPLDASPLIPTLPHGNRSPRPSHQVIIISFFLPLPSTVTDREYTGKKSTHGLFE